MTWGKPPSKVPEVVVVNTVPLVRASALDWEAETPRSNLEANTKAERIANLRMERHEAEMRANGWLLTAKLGSYLSVWKKDGGYQMVLPSGPEPL